MRKVVHEYTVYNFDELTEEAKQKALGNLADINVDYEWWDYIYEDAERIGLKITGFDLYHREIDGELLEDMQQVCKNIMREYGNATMVYVTAEKNLHRHGEDNEEQFLKDLLEDFREILQEAYDYNTSEEAIIETIHANEYEFTEDGKLA